MVESRARSIWIGRRFFSGIVAFSMLLAVSIVVYVPETAEAQLATIDNGIIRAEFDYNWDGNFFANQAGPGIINMWYKDMWGATLPGGANHDLVWYGEYDYIQVDGPWEDGSGNAIDNGWGPDSFNYYLRNGAVSQIDATTVTITFNVNEGPNRLFTLVKTYEALPNMRIIKVTYSLTNNALAPHTFTIYDVVDSCTGDGPLDPEWDDWAYVYNGGNWKTFWPAGNIPQDGWFFADGVVFGLNNNQDIFTDNGIGNPATPGSDGLPDDYVAVILPAGTITDTQWYVGIWFNGLYGNGQWTIAGGAPYKGAWNDVLPPFPFGPDGIPDGVPYPLAGEDIDLGMMYRLKGGNSVGSNETVIFEYFIGEGLPQGKDLVITNNDITIEPDYGSTYEGTTQYINATIWNLGDTDVTENFTVSFYTGGDPDIDDDGVVDSGSLLGTATITNSLVDPILPSGFKTASFSWDTTGRAGIHDIWALVDYPADTGGVVVEINEIVNNQARYDTSGLPPGTEPPFATNPPFYEVIAELPAPKNLTADVIGANIVLTWEPVVASILDHYIIYCANSQIDFNFNSICATTTTIPWADPSAITDGEKYYIVRAANAGDSIISSTSNTAGKWTITLSAGLSTLSKPLEYFGSSTPMTVHDLTLHLGANSISWQDALSDNWFVHEASDGPGVDDTNIAVGDGYEVDLPAQTKITFTGLPAAMIKFDDSSPGFDPLTDAKSISAQVIGNNIDLTWSSLGAGIEYYVYWSDFRDGFFTGSYSILNGGLPVPGTSYTDVGAASAAGENYYLIVPYYTATGAIGSSTYSIGVWTAEYNGNDFFALPLKPISGYESADWYTDQIPNCLGIVYLENGIWKAHFKEFPAGVYDTTITYGRGYGLSVYASTLYSHIGW